MLFKHKEEIIDYTSEEIIESSILGFAVGDALGVPVEFQSREVLKNNKVTDMEEYGTHYQPKGTWSDDTSMVLATMDAISSNKNLDYKIIMNNFLKWKNNGDYTPFNKVFDIGNSTSYSLSLYQDNIKNNKQDQVFCGSTEISSNGNGSLMRILPISLFLIYVCKYNYSSDNFFQVIKESSSLTHAHNYSILGCYIYSCYIAELINTKNKVTAYKNLRESFSTLNKNNFVHYDELKKIYGRLVFNDISKCSEKEIKSSGYVVDSLEAAIWCLLTTNTFEDAVIKAVNLGEDTDTIGALVGGLAGMLYKKENIPTKWLECLQNKDMINKILDSFILKLVSEEN